MNGLVKTLRVVKVAFFCAAVALPHFHAVADTTDLPPVHTQPAAQEQQQAHPANNAAAAAENAPESIEPAAGADDFGADRFTNAPDPALDNGQKPSETPKNAGNTETWP